MNAVSPQKDAELKAFWNTDQPIRILAARWGCSKGNISAMAKRRGLPSRRLRAWAVRSAARRLRAAVIVIDRYLQHEASTRGLTVSELRTNLIDIIIKDRLVGAILDDGPAKAA